jgi:hypothetical protein
MKIKASDISLENATEQTTTHFGSSHLRYTQPTYINSFGEYNFTTASYEYLDLDAGTSIRIKINFEQRGSGSYTAEYDETFLVQGDYTSDAAETAVQKWFDAEVVDLGQFALDYTKGSGAANNRTTGWDFTLNNLTDNAGTFWVRAHKDGTASRKITTTVNFTITKSDGTIIFETEPDDLDDEVFYESGLVFDITSGLHEGNVQDQTLVPQTSGVLIIGNTYTIETFVTGDDFTNVGGTNVTGNIFTATDTTPNDWTNGSSLIKPATSLLDSFNCYVMGNGVESYKYLDSFNVNSLQMNLRPNAVDPNGYKEVRRYADLTYSEPYNDNTSLNGLNEFNLSRANWKDDIEKKYGAIQKLYSRDTDVVLFQEDKVSYVLFGKDVLYNADGTTNLSKIDDVLGRQVMYAGEYGISDNPESFAFNANTLYWTDSRNGSVLKLGGNGIFEISELGAKTWFKDKFKDSEDLYKVGAFDPYYDQYVLSFVGKTSKDIDNTDSTLTFDEGAKGWTSFHSFNPDLMIGLNNSFYSFDNGNLYQHHDPDNRSVNRYYGETYSSKVAAMINDEPSVIKDFQALSLEGSIPFDCDIKAYITGKGNFIESHLTSDEFIKKEGLWYAYMRRNEDDEQMDSKAVYGIGRVVSVANNKVTYEGGNDSLTVGDRLYGVIDGYKELVGTISNIVGSVIYTSEKPVLVTLAADTFLLGRKNARIEGGNLRGYTARVDMTLTPEKDEELFAVNLEVAKSSG